MSECIGMTRDRATIELRLEKIADLFDPFDPFPMPSRDLSKSAEDFIVGWAREMPEALALSLIVHVPEAEARGPQAPALADAIARHFNYRAERVRGDLHELIRIGRVSLMIGLGVLGLGVLGGRLVSSALGEGPTARFFSEGLIILGWVANWRPIEIFLYDWWPLVRRRRLFERLAAAPVRVLGYSQSS
ncbi:MAG: hypothetical protein ABL864_05225 [Terricaulis sp.]